MDTDSEHRIACLYDRAQIIDHLCLLKCFYVVDLRVSMELFVLTKAIFLDLMYTKAYRNKILFKRPSANLQTCNSKICN